MFGMIVGYYFLIGVVVILLDMIFGAVLVPERFKLLLDEFKDAGPLGACISLIIYTIIWPYLIINDVPFFIQEYRKRKRNP